MRIHVLALSFVAIVATQACSDAADVQERYADAEDALATSKLSPAASAVEVVPVTLPGRSLKVGQPEADADGNVNEIASAVPGSNLKGTPTFQLVKLSAQKYKAVFVIFFHGSGVDPYKTVAVRRIAEENGIAILGVPRIMQLVPGSSLGYGTAIDADRGAGQSIFNTLEDLAAYTGHPELATAPIALFGHSRAGVLAASIAAWRPDRVLATIDYKPGSEEKKVTDIPMGPTQYEVPHLVVVGSKDGTGLNDTAIPFFKQGRQAGAPWAFVNQINAGHSGSSLTLPGGAFFAEWLAEVARRRLSEADGSTLSKVQQPTGIVGDNRDLIFGAFSEATAPLEASSWLGSAPLAKSWQSYSLLTY